MVGIKELLMSLTKAKKKYRSEKRRMEKRIISIQQHHITYNPPRIVPVFKGEHWGITQFQRRKFVSTGFIQSIEFELERLRKHATDLSDPKIQAHRQDLLESRKLQGNSRKRKAKAKRNKSSRRGLKTRGRSKSDVK